MPVYGIAQGTCPFSVHHPDAWQMGQVGVVQVFVQKRQGLVHGLAQEVDLRGDGHGLGHLHLAGAVTAAAALELGGGDGLLLDVDQVFYIGMGADDAALDEQRPLGVRQGADSARQAHGDYLHGVSFFQLLRVDGLLVRGFQAAVQ